MRARRYKKRRFRLHAGNHVARLWHAASDEALWLVLTGVLDLDADPPKLPQSIIDIRTRQHAAHRVFHSRSGGPF